MSAVAQWEWLVILVLVLAIAIWELVSVRRSQRRGRDERERRDR
jgi:hypothetical protein